MWVTSVSWLNPPLIVSGFYQPVHSDYECCGYTTKIYFYVFMACAIRFSQQQAGCWLCVDTPLRDGFSQQQTGCWLSVNSNPPLKVSGFYQLVHSDYECCGYTTKRYFQFFYGLCHKLWTDHCEIWLYKHILLVDRFLYLVIAHISSFYSLIDVFYWSCTK
jgi:hypothetical protein